MANTEAKGFDPKKIAEVVRKQIAAESPDRKSGYRTIVLNGKDGRHTHLTVSLAPDGHYIGQFNHTLTVDHNGDVKRNPKAAITFATKEKLLALKAELDAALAAADIVEVLNKDKPVSVLGTKSGKGVSLY